MNRSRILRVLWHHPRTSRVDVAALLGLDKSTVSSIVAELIKVGLVHEASQGNASPLGGRRPVHLELNADYGYVMGVELQPDFFRAELENLAGEVLIEWSEERPRGALSFDEYVIALLEELLAAIGEKRERLIAIGVAMGGLVNSIQNVISRSIPMKLDEAYDFQVRVADRLGLPIVAENDANACAWGELAANRGRTVHDFLCVLFKSRQSETGKHLYGGIGVGLGVAINGTLYPGSRFTAGEFRSAFWKEGNVGQFSLSEEEAAQISGDTELRLKLFRELARNIALIVNVLNLDHLFIGGDVIEYERELTPIIREELVRNWPYETGIECEINYSTYRHRAVVAGAAAMMLDRLFSDQIFPLGDIRNRFDRAQVLERLAERQMRLEART